MTLDDILKSLFASDHGVTPEGAILTGKASLADGQAIHVLGFTGGQELGIDDACTLARHVLAIARSEDATPLLFLVDSSSQRMSRRDELMGLSEFLSHLAKSLLLAEQTGHRTIGLLYGGSTAGALIATAFACGTLVALPGAHPAVMDLASMSRVTKLSVELLTEKAQATPVFAPGLDNLALTGAIHQTWDPDKPLDAQLSALLATPFAGDTRALLGRGRGGRLKAADIADRVVALAQAHG